MLAATDRDLYRSGNATSALMQRLRLNAADPDVETFFVASDEWVRAGTGGVSTFEAEQQWRGPTWILPTGATIPDALAIRCDVPGHWMWEPAQDMSLTDYVAALENMNVQFIKKP